MAQSPEMKRYEQFSHTADIGMRAYGSDLKVLFENAAFGMFDIIADLDGLKDTITENFSLRADNYEELLVAWLDELLYSFYTKSVIFNRFEIEELGGKVLRAKAFGREVGANRNRLKTEIKAATYSDLSIKKTSGGYSVEVIFDV